MSAEARVQPAIQPAELPALALTCGDPAGIGLELSLKAWCARDEQRLAPFYLIAHSKDVQDINLRLGLKVPIKPITRPEQAQACFAEALPLFDLADYCAVHDQANSCIQAITLATQHCHLGQARALVTNPLNKYKLYQAGFDFPGHTEFLAHLCASEKPSVMMLACDTLKVVPATLHLSLQHALGQLDAPLLAHVLSTTYDFLQQRFGVQRPRIAIAGLNPHAGEQGAMGREEVDWIAPLLERLRREKGWDLLGPLPADTLFHARARARYDAAVCMYHDQALIPIKTIAFDEGVNITMGLDIVRTSPDHGTAYDIAGKGIANPSSLCAALRMADKLSRSKL